jgi:hypothetical protein
MTPRFLAIAAFALAAPSRAAAQPRFAVNEATMA